MSDVVPLTEQDAVRTSVQLLEKQPRGSTVIRSLSPALSGSPADVEVGPWTHSLAAGVSVHGPLASPPASGMHARLVHDTMPAALHMHMLHPSVDGKVLPGGCDAPP